MDVLESAEKLTRAAQHAITGRGRSRRNIAEAEISADFRANGTTDPEDDGYKALAMNNFADYRLKVRGLVEQPMEFSLADLRAMPSRTQITRHDCVEGWSCIGKWKGVQLSRVLEKVRPKPEARFVMFYSADPMEDEGPNGLYYESIDMQGAHHPQTILAYDMNDQALSVPMARRCGCATSASSATRWRNTSWRSSWSKASPISAAARAAIGKTRGMNGMRGFSRYFLT